MWLACSFRIPRSGKLRVSLFCVAHLPAEKGVDVVHSGGPLVVATGGTALALGALVWVLPSALGIQVVVFGRLGHFIRGDQLTGAVPCLGGDDAPSSSGFSGDCTLGTSIFYR